MVRGLTTAASIWAVAAIGLSIGGGLFIPALIATGLALLVLEVMRPLEKRLAELWRQQAIQVEYDPAVARLEHLLATVEGLGLQVGNISVSPQAENGLHSAEIRLLKRKHRSVGLAVHALASLPGVTCCALSKGGRNRSEGLQ